MAVNIFKDRLRHAELFGKHGLDSPDNPIKFEIRPAFPIEAGFFYAMPPEEDARLGTVGHVRIDFGRGGDRFWHTWWPRGPERLNTPEFKEELEQVVNHLRRGVLKDLANMRRWCHEHGGGIGGGWSQNYGYIVETEHYRYCLRCNPVEGDYPRASGGGAPHLRQFSGRSKPTHDQRGFGAEGRRYSQW